MTKPKVVIIGGGSAIWTRNLINDFTNIPSLHGSEIVLVDIDEIRLIHVEKLIQRISDETNSNLRISSTLDRKGALQEANYVIIQIAVGGVQAWKHDLDIPWEQFKIYQTVGDTIGPGGIFRAFRSIPVLDEIMRDVKANCPDAWVIQLTNPMTTICRALDRTGCDKVIGYCHGVVDSEILLSRLLGLSKEQVSIYGYGVNHFLFIKNVLIDGEDGMPQVEHISEKIRENYPVLFDLWRTFGIFPINFPVHPSEFVPYYLSHRHDYEKDWLLDQHIPEWHIRKNKSMIDDVNTELALTKTLDNGRSKEKIVDIIEAIHCNKDFVVHVNVRNNGAILNLPSFCNVEVPAVVNKRGVSPFAMGKLPQGVDSLVQRIVDEQELIVEAALQGSRELAIRALALDPLVNDIHIARQLFDALYEAHKPYLPQF